jgi:hypothetical protein
MLLIATPEALKRVTKGISIEKVTKIEISK